MFTKAMVLTGQGPDRIFMTTDLPGSFTCYSEPLVMQFEATAGTGVDYVREYFNIQPSVVDRGTKLQHFKD